MENTWPSFLEESDTKLFPSGLISNQLQKRKLNPIFQVQGWQPNLWTGSLSHVLKQQPGKETILPLG